MPDLIDLHTHSNRSDGVLSPTALVARAAARGVSLLALTDHDTVAGCDEARAACQAAGIRFVTGIEISTQWRGQAIHVVGLGVDTAASALAAQVDDVREDLGRDLDARARWAPDRPETPQPGAQTPRRAPRTRS